MISARNACELDAEKTDHRDQDSGRIDDETWWSRRKKDIPPVEKESKYGERRSEAEDAKERMET